jgi:RES domain
VSPVLQTVAPGGPLFRIGRSPDVWALAPWMYAGPDGTFGNRYDDPAREYRVLYAAGQRRGAFLETLARFRVDLQLVAEMDAIEGDERDDAFPTVQRGVVPGEWLVTRRIGTGTAASLWFVDVAHSDSLAHLRGRMASRLVHYGLDDLDAGDLRRRAPRALTQEISRYVFEHALTPDGEPVAGLTYRSRLGDELTNWAVFEDHHLDEIVESDTTIAADDPDLVAALETLGLALASMA